MHFFSPIRATCAAYRNLLDCTAVRTLGNLYKSHSSSICWPKTLRRSLNTSSFLGSNIFLDTLFSSSSRGLVLVKTLGFQRINRFQPYWGTCMTRVPGKLQKLESARTISKQRPDKQTERRHFHNCNSAILSRTYVIPNFATARKY
jgi:hypothetical protein